KIILADVEQAAGNSCNKQLQDRLRKAAEWLSARRDRIEKCRASGLWVDVLVNGWIDGDQMDLTFPPAFLLPSRPARLPIQVITNDRGSRRTRRRTAPRRPAPGSRGRNHGREGRSAARTRLGRVTGGRVQGQGADRVRHSGQRAGRRRSVAARGSGRTGQDRG